MGTRTLRRTLTAPRKAQTAESVYEVIELIGTSSDSWEKAAKAAVERARNHCEISESPR
jgi:dodecin